MIAGEYNFMLLFKQSIKNQHVYLQKFWPTLVPAISEPV